MKNRGLSFLIALAAGAVLGILMTPRTGRASRAWMRERFDSLRSRIRNIGRGARQWQAYQRGKAAGVVHDLRAGIASRGPREKVDDDIVTARVRTNFGEHRLTWHLPRLNVDTVDGVVTLRGHLPSERERQVAERIAARVSGVRRVVNKVNISLAETRPAEG